MDKNIKRLAEIKSHRAWCITVIEYISEVDNSAAYMLSNFKAIVEATYKRRNLGGLKILKKDLAEMVGDLSSYHQSVLSKLIIMSTNEPLVDLRKEAECIVLKGYIDNDDDYRFLNNFLDYLIEDNDTKEIRKINQILDQYYDSLKPNTENTKN
ncbi:MAG: hypothetical protein MJK10_01450 [Pseudomonadales bacterium]|nr:hypothetical protein [Pseudomonadales bacterium]NRA14537.1 hypothetical protein [Oceanospirillaceae bacterium]